MSIYKDEILHHYKKPHNFGKLENPTHSSCEENLLCGDNLCMDVQIENESIKDIKFFGEGCAISVASGSLLTDYCVNKPLKEVENMTEEQVLELLNIEISNARIKCALLPLVVLKKALASPKNN